MGAANRPKLNLIFLQQVPILEQLLLEEALLRVDHQNWCLINQNPPEAIVMGISAQPEQVINFNKVLQHPVPIIRRFSGGGTVFIDHNCVMATFICNQHEINVPCFPSPVLQWAESLYRPIFKNIDFRLRENDFVIGQRKFGGNAQYMTKKRWLHHTSFLWDYDPEKMDYLKMPPKMPEYRLQRSHKDFLCSLKEYFINRSELFEMFYTNLEKHFIVEKANADEVMKVRLLPHRSTSKKELLKGLENCAINTVYKTGFTS